MKALCYVLIILLLHLDDTRIQAPISHNIPLRQRLESIYASDQDGRQQNDAVAQKYGTKSPQMDSLWQRIAEADARNLRYITGLLDSRGWPTIAETGETGTQTIFLVIQHSNLPTMKKYFPLARQAMERGDLAKSDFALLQDRLLMWQGKPQLYGSQLTPDPITHQMVLYKIQDEAAVDERRSAMGLEPLEAYVRRFGLGYQRPGSPPAPAWAL